MIKICYVCTGGTCRSIMAERLTKMHLKKNKIEGIKASSCGINAQGENIAKNAQIALKKMGASGAKHKAVKLKKIDSGTLYVVMSEYHRQFISGKVISMKDLIGHDILDPYGQDEKTYYECALEIDSGVRILLNKILKMESGLWLF